MAKRKKAKAAKKKRPTGRARRLAKRGRGRPPSRKTPLPINEPVSSQEWTSRYAAPKGGLKAAAEGSASDTGFKVAGFVGQLNAVLQRLGAQVADAKEAFVERVQSLRDEIVERTPVDTGAAAAAWSAPVITETPTRVDARISNGVKYAVFLEYGSSKQAPSGMVRVSLDRMQAELQGAAK